MLLPRTTACDCGHSHLIVFAHVCGYYSRAATIRGAVSIRINMGHVLPLSDTKCVHLNGHDRRCVLLIQMGELYRVMQLGFYELTLNLFYMHNIGITLPDGCHSQTKDGQSNDGAVLPSWRHPLPNLQAH